jgi:superfamily II RNA helicase
MASLFQFRNKLKANNSRFVGSNDGLLEKYESIQNKALDLPYEPYKFQKQSAVLIDRCFAGDPVNVLASSPTGSGKSFLIQWCSHRAWETGQKLVIVVPLVSLALQTYSNLKTLLKGKECTSDSANDYYDDYGMGYGDDEAELLGIHTGSCEVNASAQILVMTFEVLQIKQNNDFSYLDTVPVVLIDEIHFISDPERGCQVEAIMTDLPPHTAVIGLSGTLPNAVEFANNIGKATNRMTHIVGKKSRPISLDYSVHIGDFRQPFVYLTRKSDDPDQSVADRWKPGALKYILSDTQKHPDRLSFRQKRGRILQLIKDLNRKNKLPAMIVSFSCRSLNSLANSIKSIDLNPKKRNKAAVATSFRYLKTRIPEEEWPLFAPLEDLARRGISVFHSQQPSLYCEIIPPLVKAGFIKLIFCTSSLSTGVDLPVKSVCVLELRRPSRHGFQPVEPSLLKQMFGRAGRPGQEPEGNAVLVQWEQPKQDLDLYHLLTCPSENVTGHGLVRPRPLLSKIQRNYEPESILRSPFSSRDTSFVPELVNDAKSYISSLNVREDLLIAIRNLEHCVESVRDKKWKVRVGDTVVITPLPGKINPTTIEITSVRPLKAGSKRISYKWILHVGSDIPEMLINLMSVTATNKELRDASEVVLLHKEIDKALFSMSLNANPYYDDLQTLLTTLEQKGFLKDGIITPMGRMVPSLVGCDDPLSLVAAWTSNAIPRDSEALFAAGLSCFLMNKRNNQPADSRGIYDPLCKIQEGVSGEVELGTSMMEPMHMWIEQKHSVADIVKLCDSNPGHITKTVLRLSQLLEQLRDAGSKVGDVALSDLCNKTLERCVRGLPFVKSTLLD